MINKLLRSQKNEVFEAVLKKSFNPSDFKWTEIDSKYNDFKVSKIIHLPTGHYFIFEFYNNQDYAIYTPGADQWGVSASAGNWYYQKIIVNNWLDYLKKEDVPDLWKAISKVNILSESRFSSVDDSPFNTEEKNQISKRLYEIEKYLISTQNLSKEHVEFVRVRLNYLEESSKRQSRQDWLHTMIGILVSIILGVDMESSAANELFIFASNSFNNMFGKLALP